MQNTIYLHREEQVKEQVFRSGIRSAGLLVIVSVIMFLIPCFASAEMIMPAGTERIEAEAFMNDTGIDSELLIPDGCAFVGDRAFYGTRAYGIILPSSVTEIGKEAFSGDPNLVWLRMDNPEAAIGTGTCSSIPVIITPEGTNPAGQADSEYTCLCPADELRENGGFYYRLTGDQTAVLLCPVNPSLIPQTVILPALIDGYPLTEMTRHAFFNCSQIREIRVASSLTAVNESALAHCPNAEVNLLYRNEIEVISIPPTVDLYNNDGNAAYDLPMARIRLLNGATIRNVHSEGLEGLNSMCVRLIGADADGYIDVGVWGPYVLQEAMRAGIAGTEHTVNITLSTENASLTIPITMRLHNERVRTLSFVPGMQGIKFSQHPGDIFTVPKPVCQNDDLAPDHDWEWTLTIGDESIVRRVPDMDSDETFALEALAEGETQIRLYARKQLTNIGDDTTHYVFVDSVGSGNPDDRLVCRGLYDNASIPIFADGSFDGHLVISYNENPSSHPRMNGELTGYLDDPDLFSAFSCAIEGTTPGNETQIMFSIGKAVKSGETMLHLRLTSGDNAWSGDIRIVSYADRQRSRLNYDIDLPSVFYMGDEYCPELTGADAGVLKVESQFVGRQSWDFDNGIRVPSGFYPLWWRVELKDLHFRNSGRYNDPLANGRLLDNDPLVSYQYRHWRIVEVRDRKDPSGVTPLLSAWQYNQDYYSADVELMEPQDPAKPWVEYPFVAYVKLPGRYNGKTFTPTMTATVKDAVNFPFPHQVQITEGYTDSINDGEYIVWSFSGKLLVDSRQSPDPGEYTCMLQLNVNWPGDTVTADMPICVSVVREAEDLLAVLPQIPATARVGDTIRGILQVINLPSVARYTDISFSNNRPTVIDWKGYCAAAGTVQWIATAQYCNGTVTLAQGNISVQP